VGKQLRILYGDKAMIILSLSWRYEMIEGLAHTHPFRPAASTVANEPLMKAARQLEGAFIEEMLRSAGLGKPRAVFGGGIGEEAFSSFLVSANAKALTAAHGLGLAEKIHESLR